MKQIKLLTILVLNTILLFSCKDEHDGLIGEFTKIGFETTEFEITNGGGTAIISGKKTSWGITGCYEMIDGEKVYLKNEFKVINDINHYNDTVYGDWYSLYKKENALTITFSKNTDESERTLWIDCKGPYVFNETLSITQK